jgi:hypothetical protein
MKHLVTHIQPHLDDIAGIWLFKKFHPQFRYAQVNFTEVTQTGGVPFRGIPVDSNPNIVHVGVCRGKFDEHGKEHAGEVTSASMIVWKHLNKEGFAPKDPIEHRAIELLMEYVFQEDMGASRVEKLSPFTIGSVIYSMRFSPKPNKKKLSLEMYNFGVKMMETVLLAQRQAAMFEQDWKNRTEFESMWGPAVALKTTSIEGDKYAYRNGFELVVLENPQKGFKQFRARVSSTVNLTSTLKKLEKIDPKAEWYLHQSKRMLICGHDIAPSTKLSKLSLSKLIDIVRK